ncbi:cytochrome c biogenesis protein CcsA [uncultured Mailhella sp.]|uniref:cytochrome C assembly family protein n=1 Tax=uncultured Mailhella sp. TaxID=1981031 RepID=UPI0032096F61
MNWTDIPSYLCLALYALATVASLAGVLGRSPRVKKAAGLLCVAGFALHSLWLLISIADGSFCAVSRGFYLLPLSWILALAGLLVARRQHMDIALHFVAPWAFFLGACALGFSGTPGSLPLVGPLFILHLAAIFVGVGVMAVAAGAGALFLWQESAIKHKTPLDGFRKDLPALGALDKVNAMATLVGFPCYTLGVLSGLLWARISWGSFMSGDFKEWISLVILALYALLFHQRQALGWRGRKPAILALVIFAASLFSMFVVNTVLSTQHGF